MSHHMPVFSPRYSCMNSGDANSATRRRVYIGAHDRTKMNVTERIIYKRMVLRDIYLPLNF